MMTNIFFIVKKREYDLSFSGLLQNPNKKAQSDIRIKILNKLYYTLFNIPLIKKKIEIYQYFGILFQIMFVAI